jgi:hypothetical protein
MLRPMFCIIEFGPKIGPTFVLVLIQYRGTYSSCDDRKALRCLTYIVKGELI